MVYVCITARVACNIDFGCCRGHSTVKPSTCLDRRVRATRDLRLPAALGGARGATSSDRFTMHVTVMAS